MKHWILAFMLLVSFVSKAQYDFDVPSVEAYIADHKRQKSLLIARSVLETSNAVLHDYSADSAVDFQSLNADLDKYTRAFDIVDLLYQSTRTALNVRDTYSSVSENVAKYKDMLYRFHEKCLKRGNIETADTIIVTINLHCIKKIWKEAEHIYKSMTDLVLYATGAAACSTADLMVVMNSINESLDHIRLFVNSAYFETWRYIQVRTGYWKSSVYRSVPLREILDGAFGRWRGASHFRPIK